MNRNGSEADQRALSTWCLELKAIFEISQGIDQKKSMLISFGKNGELSPYMEILSI